MLQRIKAAFEDDVRRVRVLQEDYADTLRVAEEKQRLIVRMDADIAKLTDQRDELQDELDDDLVFLKQIDAELASYPQDVIDEA